MTNFICSRCNYETYKKSSFKSHLLRKNVCNANNSNITILDVALKYESQFGDILDIIIERQKVSQKLAKVSRKLAKVSRKLADDKENIKCKYCDKIFSHKSSKSRHEKTRCDTKNKLEKQQQTFINNGTIINNTIQFGNEDLLDILHKKDVLKVLRAERQCIQKLVEVAYCNDKYPQLQNIKIKNLKGKYALIYDADRKCFVAEEKEIVIPEFTDNRYSDISMFLDEYGYNLNNRGKEIIQYVLDEQSTDSPLFLKNQEIINKMLYNYHK